VQFFQQIHKKAESFLTWLKEAEEESEDDSDEDVELEFDERAKISTIKEKVFLLQINIRIQRPQSLVTENVYNGLVQN